MKITTRLFFAAAVLAATPISTEETLEDTFTQIYDNKAWGTNASGEASSGGGSKMETTKEYRSYLQDFLQAYNIQTVVDAGCGDWEFSQAIDWSKIDYVGYDVVQSVIEKNQALYSQPNIHFIYGNALETDLPEADLLLCKDVLQHLSNTEIMAFLGQLHKFSYCLLTNDINQRNPSANNKDVNRGGWHCLDLTTTPFNLQGINVLTFASGPTTKQVCYA